MRGIMSPLLAEQRVPYGRDHERHFPDRGRAFHFDWNTLKGPRDIGIVQPMRSLGLDRPCQPLALPINSDCAAPYSFTIFDARRFTDGIARPFRPSCPCCPGSSTEALVPTLGRWND
jgi:hypothetical protein